MEVFDLLSNEERDLIVDYIDNFGFVNTSSYIHAPLADLRQILREWNVQKSENLVKLFNNELILRRPYTYTVSVDGIASNLNAAIRNHAHQYNTIRNWFERADIYEKFRHIFPVSSTSNLPYQSLAVELGTSLCAEWLAKNSWLGDDFKVTFEDGEVFKICSGMKIMKVLHKFIQKYNGPEDAFEDFRNWHSKFLNQKYLDGELCLSIHPLDFMTMSDNDCDWSSCMRWTSGNGNRSRPDPGDYRAGTVECLNSPYIIVAYLHNPNKPMQIGDFEWNNKKWRELFIVNEAVINEIKGYPYQDENLTNTVLMWIKELAQNNLGWTYEDDEIDVSTTGETQIISPEGDEIFLEFETNNYMYNDIGTLKKHRGRVNTAILFYDVIKNKTSDFNYSLYSCTTKNDKNTYVVHIPYGGDATCMCCGRYLNVEESTKVICDGCEPSRYCAHCGAYLPDSSDVYWVNDYEEPICFDCYDYECSLDEITNEMAISQNMTTYHWLLGYNNNNKPIFFDKTFMTEAENERDWDRIFNSAASYDTSKYTLTHYVTLDMANNMDKFFALFDLDGLYDLPEIYDSYGVTKPIYPINEEETA